MPTPGRPRRRRREILRSFAAGLSPDTLRATPEKLYLSHNWGSRDLFAADTASLLGSGLAMTRFDGPERIAYGGGGMAVGPAPAAPPAGAPAIAGVGGPVENGAPITVTLTGANLGADVAVWLQGTRHRGTVLASSPSSLTVELPAAVAAGSHRVVVSRPLAGGPASGISDLPLEIRPAVAYQPGQEVYVTSYGSDRITVFEPGGGIDSIQVQHYGTGIVVTPDGSTGRTVTASFTVVDATVPVVTVTEPADGAELLSPTVTVRGTVSEPAEVTVNGVAAALDGLTFTATVTLTNAGANRIVVHAVDASGNRGMAIVGVTVLDAAPPELELAATPAVLWPPNHKMVTVTIDVRVSDDTDPSPEVVLVSVTSSEPDDAPGRGDGATTNDISAPTTASSGCAPSAPAMARGGSTRSLTGPRITSAIASRKASR
ncbi:MAG: hypothetical protein GY856_33425 [bacterium]|nr:hypothetical protein [bacterium]